MNILLTNDDGVHAEGLLAAKNALKELGEVFVLAPDRPRSACGHSITLHKPLRVQPAKMLDGAMAISCSGTPTDCVNLALLGVLEEKMDLVVSGINIGPNLGWDLTYSGTVSAAMEGSIMGLPSVAVSVASHAHDVDFSISAKLTVEIARLLSVNKLPGSTFLNVNVPALPADQIKGIRVTRVGKRTYSGQMEKRVDPMGRVYYWLGGDEAVDHLEPGTDVQAIAENYISITPVHMDLTVHKGLEVARSWGIETGSLEGWR